MAATDRKSLSSVVVYTINVPKYQRMRANDLQTIPLINSLIVLATSFKKNSILNPAKDQLIKVCS